MIKILEKLWNFGIGILHGIYAWLMHLLGKEPDEALFDSLIQFVKFGIVGVSNTLVSYIIYTVSLLGFRSLHLFAGSDYYPAQFVAFVLSVLWSFYWNNKMVFRNADGKRNLWKALAKTYVSYSVTGLFLSMLLLHFWVDMIGISEFIAPIINLLVTVPLNFLLNKFWAFNNK